jgi:hypothetical protein
LGHAFVAKGPDGRHQEARGKLLAKGKTVDFKELLKLEPERHHEHPERFERPLEAVARSGKSVPRAVHVVIGMRHDRREESASLVCGG